MYWALLTAPKKGGFVFNPLWGKAGLYFLCLVFGLKIYFTGMLELTGTFVTGLARD